MPRKIIIINKSKINENKVIAFLEKSQNYEDKVIAMQDLICNILRIK